ncbi:MAG: sulfur carrier protein ThiS [Taibaiella sp.]|nr:sulfur carrier protein ThiS [Taibaiella sp.]
MEVLVNNKAYTLPGEATVESMLLAAGVSATNGIAVAVNSDVVPRDQWQEYKLNNNDKIMIIKATQGG